MHDSDITIIGAGVIGLAIAYHLSSLNKNITVIEKNDSFGQETSSRNSEVIHAGLYYLPGSQKAETCIRGSKLLYELSAKHNIPHKKIGKLVVACNNDEVKKIEAIYQNAYNCAVTNLRFLESAEIKKLEPNISAKRAFFSPDSGIIDAHCLMNFFYHKAKQDGVIFSFSTEAVAINKKALAYEITVKEPDGELFSFATPTVINSAGLNCDKVAQMVGIDIDQNSYRLNYCKGQYFRIRNPAKFSLKHLVYPPATKIDLGIHLTPDLAGGLRLGPDARYVDKINYQIEEADQVLFYESVRKFIPSLEPEELIPDTAGVRPKLQKETESFRDFVIKEESDNGFPGLINLIGIEYPGLTACLAIAERVKNLVKNIQ